MKGKVADVQQSGVIPYRLRSGRIEIALVTSRSGKGWTIPKGHIERDLSPADSAAKEAKEEAGLLGRVHERPVGCYRYYKRGAQLQVTVFPLCVHGALPHWDEMGERERKWFCAEKAAVLVRYDELGMCIRRFVRRRQSSLNRAAA